jgi:hypothetical protein
MWTAESRAFVGDFGAGQALTAHPRKRRLISSSCEAPGEELDRGEVDHGGSRDEGCLEVFGQPVVAAEPSERPLDTRSYNVAGLSFEWSAVLAREHLVDPRWNTAPSARLGQRPLPGCKTGTDGGAHGSIDAASCCGGTCLLREHETQPALPSRDICPHRADHAQARPGQCQGRVRGRRSVGHHWEG